MTGISAEARREGWIELAQACSKWEGPAEGTVTASADTPCTPGDSDALSAMVGDDENRGDDILTWRSIPATEGVDSVPQFYFPAGGPVYFNEDESLVEPQPVVTDPPKAPFGN